MLIMCENIALKKKSRWCYMTGQSYFTSIWQKCWVYGLINHSCKELYQSRTKNEIKSTDASLPFEGDVHEQNRKKKQWM